MAQKRLQHPKTSNPSMQFWRRLNPNYGSMENVIDDSDYPTLMGEAPSRYNFTVSTKRQSATLARSFGQTVLAAQKNAADFLAFRLSLTSAWQFTGKTHFADHFIAAGGTLKKFPNDKYRHQQYVGISEKFGMVTRIDQSAYFDGPGWMTRAKPKFVAPNDPRTLDVIEHANKSHGIIFQAIVRIDLGSDPESENRSYSLYVVSALADTQSFQTFLSKTARIREPANGAP